MAATPNATSENATSTDLSGDGQEARRDESLEMPMQELVERMYQVHSSIAPTMFAAVTLALIVLLSAAIYFILETDGYNSASTANHLRGPYSPASTPPSPVLCCYYDPAWSDETRRGAWAYDLRHHFPHEHCSHAVFLGARYKNRTVELPDQYSEPLAIFLSLRRRGLSILASVQIADIAEAAQDAEYFAANVGAWLRLHGFQGLEIDVDHKTLPVGYDALVKALSSELRAQKLIFSVNVYLTRIFLDHVNIKQLHDDSDMLVLNTQDLVNDDQVTAAHSALYGKDSWNSSLAAVYAHTGSLSRLLLVVPFASRELELQEPLDGPSSVSAGLGCRGPAKPSRFHADAGVRAFFEVCGIMDDPSWSKVWQDNDYCYMQAKDTRFIILEERESVICKVKFAAAHRLMGVALKQLDADAFRPSPECGPAHPLLDAVLAEAQRLQPRREGDPHLWTHAERRLTVVRANGKTACLSHVH